MEYAANNGEVILDWPEYDLAEPQKPVIGTEIRLKWSEGRGRRPKLSVCALLGGERIVNCECISCGEFTDAETAQDGLFVDGLFMDGLFVDGLFVDGLFVDGLFIDDEYQGKGLGRCLLQRALSEMYGAEYHNASISTDWHNHRALLFYGNYGFRRADWTFSYEKILE